MEGRSARGVAKSLSYQKRILRIKPAPTREFRNSCVRAGCKRISINKTIQQGSQQLEPEPQVQPEPELLQVPRC